MTESFSDDQTSQNNSMPVFHDQRLTFKNEVSLGGRLYPVQNVQVHPHDCIGLLMNSENIIGTAFMVSPDLIITAAHVVYNRQSSRQLRDLRFYPAPNGPLKREDGIQIEDFRFPEAFKSREDSFIYFDYALVKIKQKVYLPKYLPLELNSQIKEKDELHLYGYNIRSIHFFPLNANQVGSLKKEGFSQKDEILYHKCPTEAGNSGSPITKSQSRRKHVATAIHLRGSQQQKSNVGRIFTKDLLKNLSIWQRDMNPGIIISSQSKEKPLNKHSKKWEQQRQKSKKQKDLEREVQKLKQRQKALRILMIKNNATPLKLLQNILTKFQNRYIRMDRVSLNKQIQNIENLFSRARQDCKYLQMQQQRQEINMIDSLQKKYNRIHWKRWDKQESNYQSNLIISPSTVQARQPQIPFCQAVTYPLPTTGIHSLQLQIVYERYGIFVGLITEARKQCQYSWGFEDRDTITYATVLRGDFGGRITMNRREVEYDQILRVPQGEVLKLTYDADKKIVTFTNLSNKFSKRISLPGDFWNKPLRIYTAIGDLGSRVSIL